MAKYHQTFTNTCYFVFWELFIDESTCKGLDRLECEVCAVDSDLVLGEAHLEAEGDLLPHRVRHGAACDITGPRKVGVV